MLPALLSTATAASLEEDLAAIIEKRDKILSKFVAFTEARHKSGATGIAEVQRARVKLLRFRRDSASTLQEKIEKQKLIVDLVDAQREGVKAASRAAKVSAIELLDATDQVLAEKQLLAELLIQQKKS